MMTGNTTPLDGCRDGWEATLRALACAQDWRRDWHALIGRGIERDRDALRRVGDALGSSADARDLTDACRLAWRDYLQVSAGLWQDAGALNLRAQQASVAVLRDGLHAWQGDWTKHWQHTFDARDASMPWRDWAAAFGAQPAGGFADAPARPNGTAADAHSN
ncbi:hypothetical protein Bsp3421_001457 [Burkholderia sp. FERM BP-3421]|uniref:hypothetical protein n=1 Tax=Burkholderia sp. FERM BP-3421 TaxID=1494466 RepID=UPI00235EF7A1|nr:hypothetical protein [Burkholderia sp. FERM BP-3421]WDD91529.1 hypothetical protein Bsp3421_001457 [Burkholderia sp. FERM BP-3421]